MMVDKSNIETLLTSSFSLYSDSVHPWSASQFGETKIGVSNEVYMTGNRSLFIENPEDLYFGSGNWTQSYTGPMPAPGSQLELTVFLKGEDLRIIGGSTASLNINFRVALKSDKGENPQSISAASDIATRLEGDFDWTPVRITLDSFPAEATSIRVHLGMLSLTTGKIYFDEITLTVL